MATRISARTLPPPRTAATVKLRNYRIVAADGQSRWVFVDPLDWERVQRDLLLLLERGLGLDVRFLGIGYDRVAHAAMARTGAAMDQAEDLVAVVDLPAGRDEELRRALADFADAHRIPHPRVHVEGRDYR
jgi:hypothetical protein